MNNQIPPDIFAPKRKSVQRFYSKIATGEIVAFVILMIFSINILLSLNQPDLMIRIWLFIIIFLIPSLFVYFFTWYYLRIDHNGITILYRFHYKRIKWTEITQITAKMRHQKQKSPSTLFRIGIFIFYPYVLRTGALQLSIYTKKNVIKTPNQSLRFNTINHFLRYLIEFNKYSIQRLDS